MQNSLIVVGSGIKLLAHISVEAQANIEQAQKVLYLVNEPLMKEWIIRINPQSESLDELYHQFYNRQTAYQAITDYILNTLQTHSSVCVVMYGHPTVYASPALEAVQEAKRQGYNTYILPGISAEACLFADLAIDPGSTGCQSFDATDLIVYERHIDNRCHLIIWQSSVIGALNHARFHDNTKGMQLLLSYLLTFYPAEHCITCYIAAQYPAFTPQIETFPLKNLAHMTLSRLATLYIPPSEKSLPNFTKLEQLGIL